jgi:Ca-activated chloride channel family protein
LEVIMDTTKRRSVLLVAALIGLAWTAPSWAGREILDVALDRPVLLITGDRTAYLKITLRGVEPADGWRAPANVAIVLDRSGSMQGEKLARAKQAAIMAIDRLSEDDIVSVLAYDDRVRVLLPATRISDRRHIRAAIESIEAGGSTALFAGVSKGAAELKKFASRNRVNRIILLSDGLANVGPDSPAELGALGASLKKEGISVSTIGLGLDFNEDLMTRLAALSDGNHAFVENPRDLARIFDLEFGDVLSVAAQEVVVRIDCGRGVRPVRILGRDGDIVGRTVVVTLNQVYGGHDKYVLLELETPPGRDGQRVPVASVSIDYLDMKRGVRESDQRSVDVRYSADRSLVERSANPDVVVAVVEQVAAERSEAALELRDQGRVAEAEAVLLENVRYIDEHARQYGSEELEALAEENLADAEKLDEESWDETRKRMREQQQMLKQQRTYK